MALTITTASTTVECLSIPTQVINVATWEEVARCQRKQVMDAIPTEYLVPEKNLNSIHLVNLRATSGILTSRELVITSLSATSLLRQIHDETYTSVEVAQAFCKTAAIAHQAVSSFSSPNSLFVVTY